MQFLIKVPYDDSSIYPPRPCSNQGLYIITSSWLITNAYFQGKPLERLLILKVPKHPKGVPDPEIQQAGYMIARVSVYGTTDAGRNLYLRIKESCKEFLSALYFITGEDNKLCAAFCTHVDDFLWAATSTGEPVVQRLLDRFKIGRIESDTFRFCGREYVRSPDGTITITCRDNTRAIRPFAQSTFPTRKRELRL